jgi:GMP synthase-like glutamine amidotransferase
MVSPPHAPCLLVIDPSIVRSDEEGVRVVIGDWPGEVRIRCPALRAELPTDQDATQCTAVVLLGSAASVHDPLPWIAALAQWLRPILSGDRVVPLLGICFGHQLIAHSAGGSVGFVCQDRRKLLSVGNTTLDRCRLLPGSTHLRVVISHREEVKTLPAGFRCVARRSGVRLDGIEHDHLPIFSFQFHPEARTQFASVMGIEPSQIDEPLVTDSERLLGAFRRLALQGEQ